MQNKTKIVYIHWSIPYRETLKYEVDLMAITIRKNRFDLLYEIGEFLIKRAMVNIN